MPRQTAPRSVLKTLKQQTTKALSSLQQEITQRERELATLKEEATRWERALGVSSKKADVSAARRRVRGRRKSRLDWNAVLTGLSASFTAKDVAEKTGKPMEQVYAGVSRWMKDKKVKRSRDGYQKVTSARVSRPRRNARRAAEPQAAAANA